MSRRNSGFTLIEVIVVVAIVAVLAALGYTTMQRWIWRARAEEVDSVFKALTMRQEAFFNDPTSGQRYVANGWVPPAPMPNAQQSWPDTGDASIMGFDEIGFRPDDKQFWHCYRMIACLDVSKAPCNAGPCSGLFTETGVPGYILEAMGDVNGDGNLAVYCTNSQLSDPKPVLHPGTEDWEGQAKE